MAADKIKTIFNPLTGSFDSVQDVTDLATTSQLSGKADTNLGNLTSTSINQNLVPDTNNSKALGTASNKWVESYVNDTFTNIIYDFGGNYSVLVNSRELRASDNSVAASWNNTGLDLDSNTISNLADPTNLQDAATKNYVDNEINGLPDPIVYKGTWSAATNTPALANTDTGKTGFLYQVSAAGSVNFGAGAISFEIGDKVVNNGTTWDKWDMTDAVTSVNGQAGVVVLDSDDVAEGSSNLYFTDARARTAAVQDSITDGVTTIAPSQNAVFDALALKADTSAAANRTLSNLTSPTAVNQTLNMGSNDITGTGVISANSANFNQVGLVVGNVNGGTPQTLPSGSSSTLNYQHNGVNGNMAVYSSNSVAANADATNNIRIETGNKTAGTGNSGSIFLRTGTSSGGTRGSLDITANTVNVNSTRIINVTDPTSAQDAATKNYVDTNLSSSISTIQNLGITATVGSNALTVSITQFDGSAPSTGAAAVKVGMRSSTLTSGQFNTRSITSALSMVVSSGSTLGHRSNVAQFVYVYLLDNAGALELAVSHILHNEANLITTVAEGGAGAADSSSVMYSTTARTSVPFRLVGRLVSSQTTAGTWASAISNIALGNVGTFSGREPVKARAQNTASTSMANAAFTLVPWATVDYDSHGCLDGVDRYTVKTPGNYEVKALVTITGLSGTGAAVIVPAVYKNGALLLRGAMVGITGAPHQGVMVSVDDDAVAGDYYQVYLFQNTGGAKNLETAQTSNHFCVKRNCD